ncbi:MAG: hypothetical protein H6569_06710 [Lewinellaceae bacterium]|nr:hypothetical protein [Lewinellaceae bacterium]
MKIQKPASCFATSVLIGDITQCRRSRLVVEERLLLALGQRPINNVVDITLYGDSNAGAAAALFFDADQIQGENCGKNLTAGGYSFKNLWMKLTGSLTRV